MRSRSTERTSTPTPSVDDRQRTHRRSGRFRPPSSRSIPTGASAQHRDHRRRDQGAATLHQRSRFTRGRRACPTVTFTPTSGVVGTSVTSSAGPASRRTTDGEVQHHAATAIVVNSPDPDHGHGADRRHHRPDPRHTAAGTAHEHGQLHGVPSSQPPRSPRSRPTFGPVGTSVTITGTNFSGTVGGASFTTTGVTFNTTSRHVVGELGDADHGHRAYECHHRARSRSRHPGGTATSATDFTVSNAHSRSVTLTSEEAPGR